MNMVNLTKIILYGSDEQLHRALAKERPLNYLDEYGYTPLIESVIKNDLAKAEHLLKAGADVNQKDMTGRSALFWAVANNNYTLCELLLNYGADANAYHMASESVLVKALLRKQEELKDLLVKHGASITFAADYINAKLLGHRYELIGSVDIVDSNGVFTEVDYEGFYLDSSLSIAYASLENFRYHYVAKHLQEYFDHLHSMMKALDNANQLLQYDHYLIDRNQHKKEIISVLSQDPLVIPINQEGHAFVVLKSGSLLAICDRICGENNKEEIIIYYINRLGRFRPENLLDIIYHKQHIQAIKGWLVDELHLQPIASIPMPAQKIGNCSWANVEAIIPVLYFMLKMNQRNQVKDQEQLIVDSIELFHHWREWDRQRALQFFMSQFEYADKLRRASIAAVLAGILFQTCSAENPDDVHRAKKIIRILKKYRYEYVLESYKKFYWLDKPTQAGKNFQQLLQIYEREEEF